MLIIKHTYVLSSFNKILYFGLCFFIKTFSNNLKYKYGNQFDQKSINNEINEKISNIYLNVTPFPQDIFSDEDYELNENSITLKSLNKIPTDYMDYINYNVASKMSSRPLLLMTMVFQK